MRKLSLIGLIFLTANAYASGVANSQDVSATPQNTREDVTAIGSAQDWGLKPEQWAQYQKLMQGPAGLWYRQLPPPAVLGMFADSEQDKERYAEIEATIEHDKLARELDFDNAVHAALLKKYASEPVIRPFDLSPFNPVQQNKTHTSTNTGTVLKANDHLVYFVDPNQGVDYSALPTLINRIKAIPGVTLDIFCVGNVNDNAIRDWAHRNNIPTDLVTSGRITLNSDNGKLQKIAPHNQVPYLLLVDAGVAKPVNVGSLQ